MDGSDIDKLDNNAGRPDKLVAEDLVAFYSLADCKANDAVGSNHGTAIGFMSASPDRHHSDSAACTMDLTGYVEIPHSPSFDGITFSVAAWVRVDWDATGELGSVVSLRDEGPPIRGFTLFAGKRKKTTAWWELYIAPDPPNPVSDPPGPSENPWNTVHHEVPMDSRWLHYAATYDGNEAAIYLDGSEVGRVTTTYAGHPKAPTKIGWWGGYGFAGGVDDVAFYKRALAPTEVAVLAAQ